MRVHVANETSMRFRMHRLCMNKFILIFLSKLIGFSSLIFYCLIFSNINASTIITFNDQDINSVVTAFTLLQQRQTDNPIAQKIVANTGPSLKNRALAVHQFNESLRKRQEEEDAIKEGLSPLKATETLSAKMLVRQKAQSLRHENERIAAEEENIKLQKQIAALAAKSALFSPEQKKSKNAEERAAVLAQQNAKLLEKEAERIEALSIIRSQMERAIGKENISLSANHNGLTPVKNAFSALTDEIGTLKNALKLAQEQLSSRSTQNKLQAQMEQAAEEELANALAEIRRLKRALRKAMTIQQIIEAQHKQELEDQHKILALEMQRALNQKQEIIQTLQHKLQLVEYCRNEELKLVELMNKANIQSACDPEQSFEKSDLKELCKIEIGFDIFSRNCEKASKDFLQEFQSLEEELKSLCSSGVQQTEPY